MNRLLNNPLISFALLFLLYKFGPDILSVIVNGMPIEEGGRLYSGNGVYYLGRDIDHLIERSRVFAPYSIWCLVPMSVVLPQVFELLMIGFFQIIGSLILIKILKFNSKSLEYSVGRSLQLSISIMLGIGVFLFFVEIFYFYIYKVDYFFSHFVNQSLEQQKLNAHPLYFLFFILVGCLGAAIFEELLFRRFLFVAFRKKMPFILATILNSLVFALCHEFDFSILLQTFACGLICCYIYEQFQSLWGCVLFHFTGNFVMFILPLFYPLDSFQ